MPEAVGLVIASGVTVPDFKGFLASLRMGNWTLVAIKVPPDWRLASAIGSIPFSIPLMLVPSNAGDELIANVDVDPPA